MYLIKLFTLSLPIKSDIICLSTIYPYPSILYGIPRLFFPSDVNLNSWGISFANFLNSSEVLKNV